MNSDIFRITRDNSSLEVEPNPRTNVNNNSNAEAEKEAENKEILEELQIKRDTRNTSEKFRDHDLPDLYNSAGDDESNASETTHDTSQHIPTLDSLDEPPLQLPAPVPTNTERNALQVMSGNIMQLLHSVMNPIRQPSLPRIEPVEQPQQPSRNPFFSLLNSLPLPLFHHNSNNLQNIANNNAAIEADHTHEQPNQNPDQIDPDVMEHGAIIVRTVHPGPNGLMIVRMRVIPFEVLFGGNNGNNNNPLSSEGPDPLQLGLFGALFRMLSHVSDIHMERGLEKDVLDSLPVVKFDTEGFKHVDEESKRCPICFDNYEDEQEIRYLWCLHRFHKGCVDQWLDHHTNCPVCKKDYSEIGKENYE